MVIVAILLTLVLVLFLTGFVSSVIFSVPSEQVVPKPITEEMDEETLFSVPVVTKLANEGDIGAQYVYGCYLLFGRGVPQDKEKGVEWIRKSADQNDAYAQGAMAYCYFKGEGVPQDQEEARKWAEKAEKSGHPVWEAWTRWEQE